VGRLVIDHFRRAVDPQQHVGNGRRQRAVACLALAELAFGANSPGDVVHQDEAADNPLVGIGERDAVHTHADRVPRPQVEPGNFANERLTLQHAAQRFQQAVATDNRVFVEGGYADQVVGVFEVHPVHAGLGAVEVAHFAGRIEHEDPQGRLVEDGAEHVVQGGEGCPERGRLIQRAHRHHKLRLAVDISGAQRTFDRNYRLALYQQRVLAAPGLP